MSAPTHSTLRDRMARSHADDFQTPPYALEPLLPYLPKDGAIWDPALLKHLGNGIFAVLAVWDLSPLEMAVLGISRQPRR